jgi:hypothetical protein
VLPPRAALTTKTHAREWFADELPAAHGKGDALYCVQQGGEALYVPEGWAHGALNAEAVVGYAHRFVWEQGESSMCFGSTGCITQVCP